MNPTGDPHRIHVLPYDPDWPRQATEALAALRRALGPRLAAAEHIGSTAVPGLAAKPVLDLMAAAAEPGGLPAVGSVSALSPRCA